MVVVLEYVPDAEAPLATILWHRYWSLEQSLKDSQCAELERTLVALDSAWNEHRLEAAAQLQRRLFVQLAEAEAQLCCVCATGARAHAGHSS